MFADDVSSMLDRYIAKPDNLDVKGARNVLSLLRSADCYRFVVSPKIATIAEQLIRPFMASNPDGTPVEAAMIDEFFTATFAPAQVCWIETPVDGGGRVGYLFKGEQGGEAIDALTTGLLVTVFNTWPDRHIRINRPIGILFGPKGHDILPPSDGFANQSERAGAALGLFTFAAFCQLIARPTITTKRQSSLDKLNKARSKRGQVELLGYSEIVLTPDAEGATVAGSQPHVSGSKALHKVRAFLRIRRGKIELVRPHWRGNAAKGVIARNYRVKSKDERK